LQHNEAGDDNNATVTFFFLFWSCVIAQLHKEGDGSRRHLLLLLFFVFFFFPCSIEKKAATLYWRKRRKLPPPSSLCCKEMANLPFFCGFVVKKVTATMSSPSSMVADFIFSLLLLMVQFFRINITITNGFFFRVVMARGRRVRKSASGELEMSKENGTMSHDTILLPNVVMSDEADAEPHVVATVEQNMAIVDEAISD